MVKKVEAKEGIDVTKLKKELTNYVDTQIKKGFNEELEKANKKVIREKNKKIFVKNVVIIILLCLIAFLLYLLNSVDYFDKFFIDEKESTKIIEKEEHKGEQIEEKTFDALKEEYGYLLDNVIISENSEYINDYYNGNLTSSLKKYIALNNIDFDKLVLDDYSVIDNSVLKEEYIKLFDDEYESDSFVYNSVKISYIEKLNSYITNTILSKEKPNIKREIVSIAESDDKVVITTIEGLVKNKKLYNIVNNEEVKDYKKDSLSNYKKYLNEVTYIFNNEKLIGINNEDKLN
ncbi:MAG: hypothetical protein II119_03465 [Bacilli bacterium]|nr:hypothetical protein [Bacilli bacterium]MBQ6282725.1 hypothetical protein [Bacilli bacterium]